MIIRFLQWHSQRSSSSAVAAGGAAERERAAWEVMAVTLIAVRSSSVRTVRCASSMHALRNRVVNDGIGVHQGGNVAPELRCREEC